MNRIALATWITLAVGHACAQTITQQMMARVYDEVKTPYKYGLVVAPQDNHHKIDCPTVFRQDSTWYMTYVCYDGKDGTDGRGYETWIAKSSDLLSWHTLGRILALPDAIDSTHATRWDQNQRGGFPALIDHEWGGSYAIQPFKGHYYMTYIGGPGTGYEAVNAPLSIGVATTQGNVGTAHQWDTYDRPLLSFADRDAQWWEQLTQYKSTVYWLRHRQQRIEGKESYPFVMFYNAGGKDATHPKGERIGIALSKDMRHWRRYDGNPVFAHDSDGTITGDAQVVSMDGSVVGSTAPVYVMFYFSAYNPSRKYNAYNTFAVSSDLVHWRDWNGPDLVVPTKPYDDMFAHKSYVVKHQGVVYHFYCAVNRDGQRGIAVATSTPMGRSQVRFPQPEPTGRRKLTTLNDGWTCRLTEPAVAGSTSVTLPHNLDDYYGYRQLRHGNLHGSAIYNKVFATAKIPHKRYFLQFEGVGTYATVTLNGHAYPRELVGRTVFTLDVTDALADGTNTLAVAVDHPPMQTESPWVCGGCSSEWGFSEGSQPFGIFRPVTLVETDGVRIEPFGVHVWHNATCDTVFVDTEVRNYTSEAQTVEVVNKLSQSSGKQVFRLVETITLQAGQTVTVRQLSPVTDAMRWSPADPYLYRLATMLKRHQAKADGSVGTVTTDDVVTPFGLRTLSWPCSPGRRGGGDGRFFLNGQPCLINGTCEYEHLLGASHAFSHEQIASRIKQVRNAGFNALREAHQPHNLYYQQLADEQGLLFWSQFSAHIWYDTPQFRDSFKRLLVRWVKERRNSPSVVLWGLQNESVLPKAFAQECCDIIRSLDPTASVMRPITTCNGGEGTDWNVVQNWSGTYGGSPDNYAAELSRTDQLLNGEYGAWRTIDLHGTDKYSLESFTALLEKKALLATQASDSVCGHFQWLLASHDNPGRVQPDGALRRIDKIGPVNYKGLTTIWEEPTPAYYMYRRHYATATVGTDAAATATLPVAADRNVDLVKGVEGWSYLYRVNCGGDDYTDEYGQQWTADNEQLSHSWGQDFDGVSPFQASQRHVDGDIRGTRSDDLFRYFRFGRHRLWYDFPVADGDYRVELYFAEPWHGLDGLADCEGLRIFDVAVNDSIVVDNLDPWAEAGYRGALKRVAYVRIKGGRLRVSFPEVKAGQAIVSAIAVATASSSVATSSQSVGSGFPAATLPAATLASAFSWRALDTDTISRLPRELLPADTDLRPATTYHPEPTRPGQPVAFVIKPGLGQEYALRFRYKNTTGQPVTARLRLVDAKKAVLADRDITFPPTPNKLKMLSTTTGTQINAGTYRLTVDGAGVEIDNIEIQ